MIDISQWRQGNIPSSSNSVLAVLLDAPEVIKPVSLSLITVNTRVEGRYLSPAGLLVKGFFFRNIWDVAQNIDVNVDAPFIHI